MSKATSITQEVEKLLTMGLRDRWYPVAASWMVGRKPVGLTRLGERLVLWRDEAGAVHALEDRCPHRGARLSLGWNLGDRLACWYHGIEVTADGTVAKVPAAEKCPLEGQHCLRAYPCQEHQGGIFAWFGRDAQAAPQPLDLPEELASPEWSSMLCTASWKCNYSYAVDNVMDPMHGAYLHAVSHSMASGEKSAVMQVRETEHGLVFEKTGQRGVNFDWVEFGETGTLWLRLAIPYQAKVGPGGPFGIVGMATPVDEDHCMVFFWRTRHVDGWERDVWRFLYRNRLEGLHWDVLEQDRVVLESMAPSARDHEMLYAHDAGVTRVRRLLKRRAEQEIADEPVAMLQPAAGAARHA